jgi:hypothetical protein
MGSFLPAFPPISYMYSSSPHSCYVPYPSHPPWLDHSSYTCAVFSDLPSLHLSAVQIFVCKGTCRYVSIYSCVANRFEGGVMYLLTYIANLVISTSDHVMSNGDWKRMWKKAFVKLHWIYMLVLSVSRAGFDSRISVIQGRMLLTQPWSSVW